MQNQDKPLTSREEKTLREILRWRGSYSIHWTPKTRESLERKGLVEVDGQYVRACKPAQS